MKKTNTLTIIILVSAMISTPVFAKMSKRTKGFLVGALAGSAVTYMINKSQNQDSNQDSNQDNANCHFEEVLKKNEYGEYEKVNIKVCS